nr:immunoglobulin heavy chain junction region [Macaca mulatta]
RAKEDATWADFDSW